MDIFVAPQQLEPHPGFDFEMPFRPTIEQVAYYAAKDDFVMLFNSITLAVSPTYRE